MICSGPKVGRFPDIPYLASHRRFNGRFRPHARRVRVGLQCAQRARRALVVTASQQPAVVMMAKGFGKVEAQPKRGPKKKAAPSAGRGAARQASADLEKLKKQGNPEYTVCVREVPEGGTPGKWLPVGGMAIARGNSRDVALSIAIFNNEEDLLKARTARTRTSKTPRPRSSTATASPSLPTIRSRLRINRRPSRPTTLCSTGSTRSTTRSTTAAAGSTRSTASASEVVRVCIVYCDAF